jgi:hypothetical protein
LVSGFGPWGIVIGFVRLEPDDFAAPQLFAEAMMCGQGRQTFFEDSLARLK